MAGTFKPHKQGTMSFNPKTESKTETKTQNGGSTQTPKPQKQDFKSTGNKAYDNAYNSVISHGGSAEAARKAGEANARGAEMCAQYANKSKNTGNNTTQKPQQTPVKPQQTTENSQQTTVPHLNASDFKHTGNTAYDNAYNSALSATGDTKKAEEAGKMAASGGKYRGTGSTEQTDKRGTSNQNTDTTASKNAYSNTGNKAYDNVYNNVISHGGSPEAAKKAATTAMAGMASATAPYTNSNTQGNKQDKGTDSTTPKYSYVNTGNTAYDNAYNSVIDNGGTPAAARKAGTTAMTGISSTIAQYSTREKATPQKNNPNATMNALTERYEASQTNLNTTLNLSGNNFVFNSNDSDKAITNLNGVIDENNKLIADIEKQQTIYRDDSKQWQQLNEMKEKLMQDNSDTKAIVDGIEQAGKTVKGFDDKAYQTVASFEDGKLTITCKGKEVYSTELEKIDLPDTKSRTSEKKELSANWYRDFAADNLRSFDELSAEELNELFVNAANLTDEEKAKIESMSPNELKSAIGSLNDQTSDNNKFVRDVLIRILCYEYITGATVNEYSPNAYWIDTGTGTGEGFIDLSLGTIYGKRLGEAMLNGKSGTETAVNTALRELKEIAVTNTDETLLKLIDDDTFRTIISGNSRGGNSKQYLKGLYEIADDVGLDKKMLSKFEEEVVPLMNDVKSGASKADIAGGMAIGFGVDELIDAWNANVEYKKKYENGTVTADQAFGGLTGEMSANTLYNLAEAYAGTAAGALASGAGLTAGATFAAGFGGALAVAVVLDGVTYFVSGGDYNSFVDVCGDFGQALASKKEIEQKNKEMDAELRALNAEREKLGLEPLPIV